MCESFFFFFFSFFFFFFFVFFFFFFVFFFFFFVFFFFNCKVLIFSYISTKIYVAATHWNQPFSMAIPVSGHMILLRNKKNNFLDTLQPLYNTVRYNTVLDTTRFKDESQKCIDCIEK